MTFRGHSGHPEVGSHSRGRGFDSPRLHFGFLGRANRDSSAPGVVHSVSPMFAAQPAPLSAPRTADGYGAGGTHVWLVARSRTASAGAGGGRSDLRSREADRDCDHWMTARVVVHPGVHDDIGRETRIAPRATSADPRPTCHVGGSPTRSTDSTTTSTTLSLSTDTTPDTGPISKAWK